MDESKHKVHDGISKTGFENGMPCTVKGKLQAKKEMKYSNDQKTDNVTSIRSVVHINCI